MVGLGERHPCEIKFPEFKISPICDAFSFLPLPYISSSHSCIPTSHCGSVTMSDTSSYFLTALLEFSQLYCHSVHLLSVDFLSLKMHFPKMHSILGNLSPSFPPFFLQENWYSLTCLTTVTYGNKDNSPVKCWWISLSIHCLVTKQFTD